MEEDAALPLELLPEADSRRSSSSSEGSLAALFYPPLPHQKAAATDTTIPRSQIRQPDMSKFHASPSTLPGMFELLSQCPPILLCCTGSVLDFADCLFLWGMTWHEVSATQLTLCLRCGTCVQRAVLLIGVTNVSTSERIAVALQRQAGH